MNKVFIGLAIVAALAVAWFILNPGETFDYVVTVESEISELENELADIEAQVTAGTLSEDQATEAKVRVITRLNAINTAATASERAELTPGQRLQLVEGLERLKIILITYQDTLATVEATADESEVQAEITRRGGSYSRSKPLNVVVADTIADVEETVQDSVQDYETDVMLDAQIEEILEESAGNGDTDEAITTEATMETEADTAMESEDEVSSDETSSNDETTTSDEPTEEEPMSDTEITTEAELEATAN